MYLFGDRGDDLVDEVPPCGHEDLSSDLQHPWKSWAGRQRQENPGGLLAG